MYTHKYVKIPMKGFFSNKPAFDYKQVIAKHAKEG
jgi:hypothetical protein